jgi:hypothetical protein
LDLLQDGLSPFPTELLPSIVTRLEKS